MPAFLIPFAAGGFAGLWVRSELDSEGPVSLPTLLIGAAIVGGAYVAWKRYA